MFTCGICYMDYDASNKTGTSEQVKMLEKCQHMFCAECFTEYYKSMIEKQNNHHRLKCPEYGCDTIPTDDEI